jgi:hypothetical protein
MATTTASGNRIRAGWGLTALVTAFLVFDGGTKVLQVAPVLEASARVGLGPGQVLAIGVILLACTVLYATPRTRILGAILLTGYLGGAVAIHVRAGSGLFETVFPIGVGGLAWLALVVRDVRLLEIVLPRR